jgi:hypothetical protein
MAEDSILLQAFDRWKAALEAELRQTDLRRLETAHHATIDLEGLIRKVRAAGVPGLCVKLTIFAFCCEQDNRATVQAMSAYESATTLVGEDPSQFQNYIDTQSPQNRPAGYDAAKAALVNAIKGN